MWDARPRQAVHRAERIANSIAYQSAKAPVLSRIAATLAATDPARAERIANSVTDQSAKASALSRTAKAMAATDPSRAGSPGRPPESGAIRSVREEAVRDRCRPWNSWRCCFSCPSQ